MMTGDAAATPSRRWRWESLTGGGAVLQEDAFRRLWLGRLFSLTALNAVLYTLLVLAVGDGNGASIKSALFITAYLLPTATLGTFSGVLVDRLPKNLVLAGVSAARFGLMLMLLMSSTSLWTVYGVALLIAMTSQFSGPAEAAALPQVVRSDQFTVANSTNNFGGLIAQVVGFAVLAPLFLNTVGPRPLFLVSGVLFAAGGAFFLTIHTLGSLRVDMDETVDAVRDVRKQFAEAWQILSRDVAAYMCVIMVVLSGTASLVAATLMPRFTQDVLDVPVKNAIYLYLPATLGIVAGLRMVHLFERRLPRGALVGAGFGLLMAAFVCLALTKTIAAGLSGMTGLDVTPARIATAICFSTIAAFATPIVGIASRSLVNERVPMGIQGRVFAAQTVLGNLASIPPILFAGVLSELVGVAPVMLLTVVILISAAGWTLAQAVSRPRELDDATAA